MVTSNVHESRWRHPYRVLARIERVVPRRERLRLPVVRGSLTHLVQEDEILGIPELRTCKKGTDSVVVVIRFFILNYGEQVKEARENCVMILIISTGIGFLYMKSLGRHKWNIDLI